MSGWQRLPREQQKQMWADYVKANPNYEAELLGLNTIDTFPPKG